MDLTKKLRLENLKTIIISNYQEIDQINKQIDELEKKINRNNLEEKRKQLHLKKRNKHLFYLIASIIFALSSYIISLSIEIDLISATIQIFSLVSISPIIKNIIHLYDEIKIIKKLPYISAKKNKMYQEEKEKLNQVKDKYQQENLQLIIKLDCESENKVIPKISRRIPKEEVIDKPKTKVKTL